jgi:hypothetical protein
MKCIYFFLSFLFIGNLTFAQGIKGRITDTKNQPIPFATIFIENLQSGTTANLNGEFEIKCASGTYTVMFRALGFKLRQQTVEIQEEMVKVDVSLETQVYQMKEVIISNKREDPAFAIMRKAIALAPYHLREVDHHNSSVYIKGTLYIDKMPKLLQKISKVEMDGQQFTIKTGDVYVEESVIDLEFNAPQFYKRKVRSLRSSFPGNNSNPVNPILTIESSFYQAEMMGAISPLSPQAFQHYKFKYLGFFEDGENVIDKIQVIPRRKSQDLFEGFLYIVEGRWCLHSLDMTNTQFWGSLNVKEIFSVVDQKAWLPVSYSISANAKMMGVKARYKYASSVKYSNIRINEKLAAKFGRKSNNTGQSADPKKDEIEKTKQMLAKDGLTNREMRKVAKNIDQSGQYLRSDTITPAKFVELNKRETDSLATKRDTGYWTNFRPVPLTTEEIKSFNEGPQSVMQKIKRDSLHQKVDTTLQSKKKSIFWVLTGKTFQFNDKKSWVRYQGLIQPDQFSFNTVDGFRYGLTSTVSLKLDSFKRLKITPWVGYAFSRKAFMWSIASDLSYGRTSRGNVGFIVGEQTKDFSKDAGMPVFMNSIYSLFLRENYKKLYNSQFVELYNGIHLMKSIRLDASMHYERLKELDNFSNYSFFYKHSRTFTPNIPAGAGFFTPTDGEFRNFIISTTLSYIPQPKFWRGNYRNSQNLFPEIKLGFDMGISGVFGSESKFTRISLGVNKRKWLSRDRYFEYNAKATYWLSAEKTHFSSYTHVKTYNFPVSLTGLENTFQHLPFYIPSTKDWLIEAHVLYTTKLLLLKRLPLISNKIWTENLYLNYLHSPLFKHHIEMGYSVGQIWAIGEIGVFTSFDNWSYSSTGVKICIDFGN